METSVISVKAALLSFVLFLQLAMGQEVTAEGSYYVNMLSLVSMINHQEPGC